MTKTSHSITHVKPTFELVEDTSTIYEGRFTNRPGWTFSIQISSDPNYAYGSIASHPSIADVEIFHDGISMWEIDRDVNAPEMVEAMLNELCDYFAPASVHH
ncbi:MAG: hypothetical protein AAF593_00555 [Planctomycetota bacterium]